MNKVKEILNQAKRFEDSAAILFSHSEFDANKYYIPACVLAALSIELSFKAIGLNDNGNFSKTHKIDTLFRNLKPETQKDLLKMFNEKIVAYDQRERNQKKTIENLSGILIESDIESIFKDLSTLFVDFRYIFEQQAQKSFFYIEPIRMAIEEYIKKNVE